MFVIKPKIVATILARNEEDIIGPMIEHHIEQGVSKIIFTDNNSTDKTRSIAESYPEVCEIIDEPENTHNQSVWVTRMARLACKLNPEWIIHLDADEFWCNLTSLRRFSHPIIGCDKMYLHPPMNNEFDLNECRNYLSFDHINIPQERKIAHRPDPDIVITHGNHGVEGASNIQQTLEIPRHHYPIRSLKQWKQKILGHEALQRRNSCCERWKNWYDWDQSENDLNYHFSRLTLIWKKMIENPSSDDFHELIKCWATKEMMHFFESQNSLMPKIEQWTPKCEKK